MLKYLIRRVVASTMLLIGLVFATFVLTHVIPSDPARLAAGFNATAQQVANIKRQMGLDHSVIEQFGRYVIQLVHGNLGTSFVTERPVSSDIALFFPATFELVVAALGIMVVGGVMIGAYLVLGKSRVVCSVLRTSTVMMMGTPSFVLALLLQIIFFARLGWFPSGGRLDLQSNLSTITGLDTLDSLLEGRWSLFISALWHLALPALSLALYRMGVLVRFVEAQLLLIVSSDYVRTAKGKGVGRWRLAYRHIARNGATPILTVIGLEFGALLGGSVLVETIFSWPGMGNYIVESVSALDFGPIIASAMVLGAAYIVINLTVDIVQHVLDPRVSAT
jgi:peptide/nickel transport system permease protein